MDLATDTAALAIKQNLNGLLEDLPERLLYHSKLDNNQDKYPEQLLDRDYMQRHFLHLSEALTNNSYSLFTNYVSWVQVMLNARGVSGEEFSALIDSMSDSLQHLLKYEDFLAASSLLEMARQKVFANTAAKATNGTSSANMPETSANKSLLAEEYLGYLLKGQKQKALDMVNVCISNGMTIKQAYQEIFQPSQYEVGNLWLLNKISVAQEHYCTAATQVIMSQFYSELFKEAKTGPKMVTTCVGKNLHEVGIRMISDFFELEGWETYYLGANAPSDSVIKMLHEYQASVLGISAALAHQIADVRSLIQSVRAEFGQSISIFVGGYAFNQNPGIWQKTGADAYAANADQAIGMAKRWV